jgi:glycine/D-amino acid oxidase-like deaminating enzyme
VPLSPQLVRCAPTPCDFIVLSPVLAGEKTVETRLQASRNHRDTVVIGGGLLGLAAANAALKNGMDASVVHLLARDLDTDGRVAPKVPSIHCCGDLCATERRLRRPRRGPSSAGWSIGPCWMTNAAFPPGSMAPSARRSTLTELIHEQDRND